MRDETDQAQRFANRCPLSVSLLAGRRPSSYMAEQGKGKLAEKKSGPCPASYNPYPPTSRNHLPVPHAPLPLPELLSPAGDWEALRAAVANGADAVYFGLSNFNARHRAHNFTVEELPDVINFLHERQVRGYVTVNTLVFSDELADAGRLIADIARSGADAVIVQDLGLAALVKRLAPALPVHGSTQMTLTDARGIDVARELGVERVILARELTTDEIRDIAGQSAIPVEVFVHGALCVAYSGQCLTSEALGGRSANRGQCAQACRLPYELIVDGAARELGDKAYLLSPKDLAAYDLVGELARIGVASLKIEGRLKSADYVAVTTSAYRAALEAAGSQTEFEINRQQRLDLEQSFSRGFSHGFLGGIDHQQLVEGRFPKSRGVRVGTVVGRGRRGVVVELAEEHDEFFVAAGDGIVFDEGHPEQDEQGGRVFAVDPVAGQPRQAELVFAAQSLNLAAIAEGALVWRTDDPRFKRRMQRTYQHARPTRRARLALELRGAVGEPLELIATETGGRSATARWPGPLALAQKHPLTDDVAREQLGRLGETPYELGELRLSLEAPVMVPKSVLNQLRRDVIEQLAGLRAEQAPHVVANPRALDDWRAEIEHRVEIEGRAGQRANNPAQSRLHVLVRNLDQLERVLEWSPAAGLSRPALVYCDFEDVRRYRAAVDLARQANMPIGLATLRVIKPSETGLLAQIARCEPDWILVRNLSALALYARESTRPRLAGDFSLNVANELTADLLFERGLERLTPSYDLNWEQLIAMLKRGDAARFEVVVHQHLPMFHMEHCVFAALLSQGHDWRDCGRPCDDHRVELRDRVGAALPLLPDTGCRNTVFNAVAQSAAEYVPLMQKLGVAQFRVEFLRETGPEVAKLLNQYARVLAGLDSGHETWRRLQVLNQLGVTRGSLTHR